MRPELTQQLKTDETSGSLIIGTILTVCGDITGQYSSEVRLLWLDILDISPSSITCQVPFLYL